MKPDGEIRHALGARDRVCNRRLSHHKAGAGEDAGIVCDFDSLIDCLIEAKIISANDQLSNARCGVVSVTMSVHVKT